MRRFIFALLPLLLTACVAGQETTTLATYQLAGKAVEAKVPSTWTDTVSRFKAAQPPADAPKWRVKAFIPAAATWIGRDADGLLRVRSAVTDVDAVLAELAQAGALLQASFGSAARVVVEAELDELLVIHGKEPLLEDYLAPQINGGGYEAEDRTYRGPYHSVVVISPVPTGERLSIAGATASVRGSGGLLAGLVADARERLKQPDAKPVDPQNLEAFAADKESLKYALGPVELPATAPSVPALESTVPEEAKAAAAMGPDAPEADRVKLTTWFQHEHELVRLNSLDAFTRVKEPKAVTYLADAALTYNTAQGETALRALAFQDTDLAWAAIRQLLKNGPIENNKRVAAELVAVKGHAPAQTDLTILITSPSWQVRRAAARALGSFNTPETQTMNLVFLQETHPAVRLAVTKGADPAVDLVVRRLNWSAVNDSSDLVRAWSYIRLMESKNARFTSEGMKGIRDDSVWVRLLLLRHLQQQPSSSARPALRLGVLDSNVRVRAEALRAWAAFPDAVTAEDIGTIWDDPAPEVKAALAELVDKKGIKRP